MSQYRKAALCAAILMLPLCGAAPAQETASLPGGATDLNESHGDWTVTCAVVTQNGASGKICVLAQQQTVPQSGERVLAMELRPQDTAVDGELVLPFGLALDKGVTLQIDDGQPLQPLRFRTCLPVGCIVDLHFDAKSLPLLRKGKILKIKAGVDSGGDTQLTVSLKGFPNALDRTIALAT